MMSQHHVDCFIVAGRGLLYDQLADRSRRLVHGIAWVEFEKHGIMFVHDKRNGNDQVCLRSVFYEVGRIDESSIKRYTGQEVSQLVHDTEHWGPWDETLLAVTELGQTILNRGG